jgi:putative SOS response-associated peptidase YedK
VCTNYTPTARDRFKAARLGVVHLPAADWPAEVFPGYEAPIIRRHDPGSKAESATPERVCDIAKFGLIPRWSRDKAHALSIAKGTYNARNETASEKPSFRSAWRERQWALVPMDGYFDPNWEEAHVNGGKPVRWRISRADNDPFACAALWERWHDKTTGDVVTSFSLLTVNADAHPLCGRLHRPGDEKRMPVIIAANDYDAWLNASPDEAHAFMRMFPADALAGAPAPQLPRKPKMPKTPENISLF